MNDDEDIGPRIRRWMLWTLVLSALPFGLFLKATVKVHGGPAFVIGSVLAILFVFACWVVAESKFKDKRIRDPRLTIKEKLDAYKKSRKESDIT
jgi:K+ transporter